MENYLPKFMEKYLPVTAFGNTLGSSRVTKGTTIAESQFVQDVPDCGGQTFDHWDYDGRVIEHEYIVRALYK